MKNIERTKHGTQILVRQFSGISDLTNFIKSTPVDSGWDDTSKKPLSYSFSGAHTYEEASEMMLKGVHLQELKKAVNKGREGYGKKTLQLGVAGICPNVPAFVAGSPACMYRMERTKRPGAYNVFVDVCVNCMTTKQQVYDAGVEILIKVLQLSSKFPVNLFVGELAKYDGKVYGNATQIMNAGKAFNIARVSYALTEPGFLRVFSFCVTERNGKFWPTSAREGYGRPLFSGERAGVCNEVFKNAIVLSTTEVIANGEHALKAIDELLK